MSNMGIRELILEIIGAAKGIERLGKEVLDKFKGSEGRKSDIEKRKVEVKAEASNGETKEEEGGGTKS